MKRLCAVAAAVVSMMRAAPAAADPSSEPTPPPFGTPLRSSQSAAPAMSGMSLVVPSAGVLYLPSTPSIQMGGPTAPRRSELFGTIGIGSAYGGGLGLKPTYALFNVDIGLLSTGGDATRSFSDGSKTWADGRFAWFGFGLVSPGLEYHKTGFVFGAQLVPRFEWYKASFSNGATRITGNAFLLTASADIHACLEYNFANSPKNSSLCLYAAPAIYRDGFFNGVSTGVRMFLF
jgi:hypothetical protein